MNPLVSVGIPTYNGPEGLRRTLEQITAQTYSHLEIIVSDNCSPNKEVKKITEEFAAKDTRIQYFRHDLNMGMSFNFQFVLKKASGEYFMWASDDDEWEPLFIETCLRTIKDAGLAMQSSFRTNHRAKNQFEVYNGPVLSTANHTFDNIIRFLQNVKPSIFYGLYRKEAIFDFTKIKYFDLFDVYFIIRTILRYGINTFPEQLYTAGIDADNYQFKSVNPKKNRLFNYDSFLKNTISEIFRCKHLTLKQKIICAQVSFFKTLWSFTWLEKEIRPVQVIVVKNVLRTLIFATNIFCKLIKGTNYYIVKENP